MIIRTIDFETTGIPTDEDPHEIVEVGWCDLLFDPAADPLSPHIFALKMPRSALVAPKRKIPVEAMAVHHLSDEECASGAPAEKVPAWLLDRQPAYFCAHNADFERKFFDGAGIEWLDTYKIALRFYPEAPSHSLQVLRYHLNLPIDQDVAMPPHRAGPDAYLGAALCAHLLEKAINQQIDRPTLVRWSNGPALLPRLRFGKHKGMKFSEAPLDYLQWIADKSDLDVDVKATARHWIKQRKA